MMSAETLAYQNGVVKVNADRQFLILRHRQRKSAGERAPATEAEETQYQGLKEHGQRRWRRETEYLSAAVKLGFLELDGAFRFAREIFRYIDKKHESIQNATTNKKADSDSEEEGRDLEKNDRHLKQEEMIKIAEPKQVWDATVADPKLLVFLKSFPNTLYLYVGIAAKRENFGWVGFPHKDGQKKGESHVGCAKMSTLPLGKGRVVTQLTTLTLNGTEPTSVTTYIEKEESKMLKQKQKECMQPKMQ
ncbi:hypothetical protein V8G54_001250 [Vigna mungo]|uniref:Uncharacterized protein n=1 Tax=Vigna mungo TaxID=3915 RepID=A0AAQ3P623_VIGMU